VAVPVAHTWDPMLRREASEAVVAMFAAAQSEAGLSLASNSAYRSYAAQQNIYVGDDELTARPGFSEHQTGLSIDVGAESGNCSLDVCFADTPEGAWLRDNAYRFGFLLRYPADKQPVTGYQFEPWHFRYIGVELAAEMRKTGVTTLEEFFGLPAAPAYQ
jgi:D-alanyl-D-alanine carboxypeptidase